MHHVSASPTRTNPTDREAIGLDLSPTGIAAARARLAALPDAEAPARARCTFEEGDFFGYDNGKFTVIYDYTFLCALPPERRGEWAERMKAMLEPEEKGLLITLIYPICDKVRLCMMVNAWKPGGASVQSPLPVQNQQLS